MRDFIKTASHLVIITFIHNYYVLCDGKTSMPHAISDFTGLLSFCLSENGREKHPQARDVCKRGA